MKRYYIIRLNGIDMAITDDSKKAYDVVEYMRRNCEEGKTELNAMTTTYNFAFRPEKMIYAVHA